MTPYAIADRISLKAEENRRADGSRVDLIRKLKADSYLSGLDIQLLIAVYERGVREGERLGAAEERWHRSIVHGTMEGGGWR